MTDSKCEDIEAIKILRSRYFRSIDTADYVTLRSVLAENLVTDLKGGNYHWRFDNREDFVEAIANALNANMAAHHVAHLPEITLTSPTTAEGIWYLQDWALDIQSRQALNGTGIIRDRYEKIGGQWKICYYQYRRVIEMTSRIADETVLTVHYLGEHGRKPAT
jgi:hypothetical protein